MNGILGIFFWEFLELISLLIYEWFLSSLLNSNRKIEPELMRQLMFDIQINSITSSGGIKVKGLELLDNQPSISSLSNTDEFSSD